MNVSQSFQCNKKKRLIYSRNDEERGSEMFFTEIYTSEIEADTPFLQKKKSTKEQIGKNLAAIAMLRNF